MFLFVSFEQVLLIVYINNLTAHHPSLTEMFEKTLPPGYFGKLLELKNRALAS